MKGKKVKRDSSATLVKTRATLYGGYNHEQAHEQTHEQKDEQAHEQTDEQTNEYEEQRKRTVVMKRDTSE